MNTKQEQTSGIVLLFDLVEHIKQTQELGETIGNEALNIFRTKIKSTSSKYKFNWVKDIDDASLFIGNDPKNAVNFYQDALKQFPTIKDRETKHCGFLIKFRLVAHFCPFIAKYNSKNQLMDIEGSEVGFLFKKMEKEANAGEMVVSEIFRNFYHKGLESEGFGFTHLTAKDRETKDRETQLYLLALPVLPKEDICSGPDTKLLFDKMNELKKDVQKIKTLGGIYPDLNMANQFIKLKLSTVLQEDIKKIEVHKVHKEERDMLNFQYESKKRSSETEHKQLLECDEIYENYPHLLIKGIPGVGKTTILKYFCYKAFNSEKYAIFIPCLGFPNINHWEKEYPYASQENIVRFMVHLITFAFIYPNKAYNEIDRSEKENFAEIVKRVEQYLREEKIVLCLDALDEVTDTNQQKEILKLVSLWIKSAKENNAKYHIYLTARDHTFTGISEDVPLASVNPLVLSQFQDLGEKFFEGKEKILKKFREESWKQETVVSVSSTPLLATLVLVYFENKGEFGRRVSILHFITLFILLKIWDRLKNPDYNKQMSIDELFNTILDPEAIEKDEELSLLINALEELVWNAVAGYKEGYISKFREDAIITILDNLFIKKSRPRKGITPGTLLDDMKKNYFLLKISTSPNYYTFIHLSILEFLATRRMGKLEINEFLSYFRKFTFSDNVLFQLEILPLFSALSFKNLNKTISALEKHDNETNTLLKDGMAFRILAEADGFIREQTDNYRNSLLLKEHESFLDKFNILKDKFLAGFASYLETNDIDKIKECSNIFNAASRFQDKGLLNT